MITKKYSKRGVIMVKKEAREKSGRTNIYLLAIVAIVAVVGIVILVLNAGHSEWSYVSDKTDTAGQTTSTGVKYCGDGSTWVKAGMKCPEIDTLQ